MRTRDRSFVGIMSMACVAGMELFAQMPDVSLRQPLPKAGHQIQAWDIATDDTKLTVGATREGQLCIYGLSNPKTGWNWTAEPSVFPLPQSAVLPGNPQPQGIEWAFKDGAVDTADGRRLTVRFVCDKAGLELRSVWWARPGQGPVRHALSIANQSDKPVTLPGTPFLHTPRSTLPAAISMTIGGPEGDPLWMWTFHSDGWTPDPIGVYRHEVKASPHPFSRQSAFKRRIDTSPGGEFVPYAVFDSGNKQGVYIGVEWGFCHIEAVARADDRPASVSVSGGASDGGPFTLQGRETLDAPPGFIGAYQGDPDDAGNVLRKWLFKYNTPAVVRNDPTYPKVQWNAFLATGETPGSWKCLESKYDRLIDAIGPLGFEEAMIDVGWWEGGTRAPEPKADPVRWPSGMAKASEYTRKAGLRFGLYWNKGEDMADLDARNRRIAHVRRLYDEHKADVWRSDNTGGDVVGASYPSFRGFYAMLEQLYREIPNFQWENCSSGGRIKDFGSMKYAVKVFNSDTYCELHNRQAFYDTSFMFPPAQIEGHCSSTSLAMSPVYAFRSCSMGAPEWFMDNPDGGNGGKAWRPEEKEAIRAAVAAYKSRIRPLVRNADLYHIFPRPDDKHWDGIEYYDPAAGKGVAYVFRPGSPEQTQTLRLRGLDAKSRYKLSFEDGSNPAVTMTGAQLMDEGLKMSLGSTFTSEWVWIDQNL